MTAIATSRASRRALPVQERTRQACAERRASVPTEFPAAVLIGHLRHQAAMGGDALLLSRVESHYFAVDDEAQIVAETIGGDLFYRRCAGLSVRLCATPAASIGAAVKALRSAGLYVAIAEPVEDAGESGIAATAVIRVERAVATSARRAFDGESKGAAELTAFAAKLDVKLAALPGEVRLVVRRTILSHVDHVAAKEAEQAGGAADWEQTWRHSLTDWTYLEDIVAALVGLSDDEQRFAVQMVNRYADISQNGSAADDDSDSPDTAFVGACMDAERPQLKLLTGMEANGGSRHGH